MDDSLSELRIPQVQVQEQSSLRQRKSVDWVDGEFLRGPIPLDWLAQVGRLPGKIPLLTALAIWFEKGRRGRMEDLKMTSKIMKKFGVNASGKSRALEQLENAGLIKVIRQIKKNPVVTILNARPE